MVTLKSSNFYTGYALESFFKNTVVEADDEFLLINNDYSETDKFSIYNKINIVKNNQPLSFAENINQGISIAIKNKKNLVFLNNDIIFTKNWFNPLKLDSRNISIPASNQLFPYNSDCGNLKLTARDLGTLIILNIAFHKQGFTSEGQRSFVIRRRELAS